MPLSHAQSLVQATLWALALAGLAQGQVLTGPFGFANPATPACAPFAPGQALNLQQTLARALCADPRTQQSHAQWQARSAQLELERAQAWPEVTAAANAGTARQRLRENGEVTVNKAGVGSAALDLSWVLLDFGQRRASTQAAQWSALAAAAAHDDTTLEVALSAASAFFALAEAQAVLQVLAQEARFTDDFLAQNAQRAAAAKDSNKAGPSPAHVNKGSAGKASTRAAARPGAGTKAQPSAADLAAAQAAANGPALDAELENLQLRADQSRAALERRLARGNLLQARGALATQLGLPPQTDLQVQADEVGTEPDAAENTIEMLLQQVLRDHPSLRSARARLGAADAALDLAQRSAAPRVSLQMSQRQGRDVLRSDSRESVLGVQLEVPLFAGFARKHREAQARAERAGAQAELGGAEQQVALQTWSAYQAVQTHAVALRQAQTYEADAKALLAGELRSYRAGNSDLHDVLDAHTTVSEAAMARLASQTSLRMARVRMAGALGRLHQLTPPVYESGR